MEPGENGLFIISRYMSYPNPGDLVGWKYLRSLAFISGSNSNQGRGLQPRGFFYHDTQTSFIGNVVSIRSGIEPDWFFPRNRDRLSIGVPGCRIRESPIQWQDNLRCNRSMFPYRNDHVSRFYSTITGSHFLAHTSECVAVATCRSTAISGSNRF